MNLWDTLQNGANRVSGLLFPGMTATGVDPRTAQLARSQAMMQMGAGLLGGQNFGQAYGLGQQAGYEPIEQARRQAVMQADAQWRDMQTQDMQRRREAEDAAAAEEAKLRAEIAPLAQAGDTAGIQRVLMSHGLFQQAKAVKDLGGASDTGVKIGSYNPGDYTPESFAAFLRSEGKDPSVLRRQYAPPSPIAPVVVSAPGYGTALVDRRTGQPIQTFATPEQEAQGTAATQAAKSGAAAQVAYDASMKGANVQRQTAWNMYQTAMEGLKTGLSGSETGPVMGRIPAVTSAQQTAEGAVAAMAPILKQIFRVAGEGTFTDRDQALLLDMVPKRTDNPAARDAKIANIDAIVAAKLGLPTEKQGAPTSGRPTLRSAPPEAVSYLKAHPETAPAFKAKYGYLPQ